MSVDDDDPSGADADESGAGADDRPSDLGEVGEVVDAEHVDDATGRRDRRIIAGQTRFRGPLPPPDVLREYDDVLPGLAQEIVDQWKGETAHRHRTIDGLRATDHEAMQAFYAGEKRGQLLGFAAIILVIGLAALAAALHSEALGVSAILTGGATAIWAMRRQSSGEGERTPIDLSDDEALEGPVERSTDDQDA